MISKEIILKLYEKVLLIRSCEEAVRKEYAGNEMKTPVHLCNGSEAIAAGVISTLPNATKIFGTYRNHGLYLTATDDTDGFFAELYGKETGCASGLAGSMHLTSPQNGLCLTSAVVGTTIPIAVGAAFANKYRHSLHVVVSFFGDGALEEGVFWESLNFACLHKLRILFVCENNDLAIHTFGHERRGFKSIDQAVQGFNCHAFGANGYSVDQVFSLSQAALKKVEEDPKPAFLRFDYFRMLEHVGVNEDFGAGYRQKPSDQVLKEQDPLWLAEQAVQKAGISDSDLKKVKDSIDRRIQDSISKARKAPFPKGSALNQHVYA